MKLGFLLLSAFLVLGPSLAQAQEMKECAEDRAKFCEDKKDFAGVTACFAAHDKELSNPCKQELERILLMKKQATARGGGALSAFGGLNAMGPPVPLISYDNRYSPGPNAPSFNENKLNISSPVWHGDKDLVSLSLAGSILRINSPLYLDNGKKLPNDLYRTELGAQYFEQLPEKKNWGFRGSVGYAGDKPFSNSNDVTYSGSGNAGLPGSGNGYWVLSVFFSNNSPLGNYIPIPGVAYIYRGETFSGMFGLPILAMQWTPVFPWAFSFALFGPTVQTEAAYGSLDEYQIYTGFYWNRQIYILADRDNTKDRLTIEEKKAALGLRTPIWGTTIGEVQAGQVFDRAAYIGNGLFNKDGGNTPIPADYIFSVNIKARF